MCYMGICLKNTFYHDGPDGVGFTDKYDSGDKPKMSFACGVKMPYGILLAADSRISLSNNDGTFRVISDEYQKIVPIQGTRSAVMLTSSVLFTDKNKTLTEVISENDFLGLSVFKIMRKISFVIFDMLKARFDSEARRLGITTEDERNALSDKMPVHLCVAGYNINGAASLYAVNINPRTSLYSIIPKNKECENDPQYNDTQEFFRPSLCKPVYFAPSDKMKQYAFQFAYDGSSVKTLAQGMRRLVIDETELSKQEPVQTVSGKARVLLLTPTGSEWM